MATRMITAETVVIAAVIVLACRSVKSSAMLAAMLYEAGPSDVLSLESLTLWITPRKRRSDDPSIARPPRISKSHPMVLPELPSR